MDSGNCETGILPEILFPEADAIHHDPVIRGEEPVGSKLFYQDSAM